MVGGGSASLEAARILAERGHRVTLFEANKQLSGQVVLAAKVGWRKSLIGIVDWLSAELDHLEITIHLNTYVEAEDLLTEEPEVVVLANGGLPIQYLPEGGEEHTITPWDFLTQSKYPSGRVLYFDQTSGEGALSAAQHLVENGAELLFVTPDRLPGYDVGAQNLPVFMKTLLKQQTQFVTDTYLLGVQQEGSALSAKCRNRYTGDIHKLVVDTVVLDQGVAADNELFDRLAPNASNKGEINLDAMADMKPQPREKEAGGAYRLLRVGDALMSRNIHAVILDARCLCLPI